MRQMLGLGSFFTTGADEVRQWTIRKGTKAPQAAGVIHGGMSIFATRSVRTSFSSQADQMGAIIDFEKTFIQCIVYNYDILKEYGNEADVKSAGKVMTKGKDYVVEVSIHIIVLFLILISGINFTNANPSSGWRHHLD